jgi:ABC-type multidrug transport system permease subunit
MMSSELLYTIGYSVLYVFPQELPILRREAGEKLYSLSAYYIHRILFMIPRALFESYFFIGMIYASVDFFTGFSVYLKMALVTSSASLLSMSYG